MRADEEWLAELASALRVDMADVVRLQREAKKKVQS